MYLIEIIIKVRETLEDDFYVIGLDGGDSVLVLLFSFIAKSCSTLLQPHGL